MALLKAPILFFAFYLVVILPESSFAQECSETWGQLRGCRSGIACNKKNQRTGEDFWICKPGPPPAKVNAAQSSSGSLQQSVPKSSSSGSRSPAAIDSSSKAPASNSSSPIQKNDPLGESSASIGGGGCPFNYYRVEAADNRSVDSKIDINVQSTARGITFCRRNGAIPSQNESVQNGKVSIECENRGGVEEKRNDGAHLCRYKNPNGKARSCFINSDGVLSSCVDDDGSTAAADGGACQAQFDQLVQQCKADADKAGIDCNQENDTIKQAMQATKAVGAGSAASVKVACSKLGKISQIANLGMTGWQSYCAYSQGSCENACTEAKRVFEQPGCIPEHAKEMYSADVEIVQDNIGTCVSYKKRISEAAQHATAALAQAQAAKKCEDDTGSDLTKANVDECSKNPNSPLCTDAQKCSNPTFAASNAVCKCLSNPNSKDCIAATGGAGNRGVAGGVPNPGGSSGGASDPAAAFIPGNSDAGANPVTSGDGSAGMGKNEPNLGGAKGNAGLGGSSGGGTGGGGSGSSALGANSAGAEGDRTKVNSGFYGGAPVGGGYFGNRPGSSGGSPNTGGVNYNKLSAGGAQFDPRRYIAGLNGKSGEFINGPGLDIFRIVKNRIESKKPSLLDPSFKK